MKDFIKNLIKRRKIVGVIKDTDLWYESFKKELENKLYMDKKFGYLLYSDTKGKCYYIWDEKVIDVIGKNKKLIAVNYNDNKYFTFVRYSKLKKMKQEMEIDD